MNNFLLCIKAINGKKQLLEIYYFILTANFDIFINKNLFRKKFFYYTKRKKFSVKKLKNLI